MRSQCSDSFVTVSDDNARRNEHDLNGRRLFNLAREGTNALPEAPRRDEHDDVGLKHHRQPNLLSEIAHVNRVFVLALEEPAEEVKVRSVCDEVRLDSARALSPEPESLRSKPQIDRHSDREDLQRETLLIAIGWGEIPVNVGERRPQL